MTPPNTPAGLFKRLGPTGPLALAALLLPPLSGFALIAYMSTISDWLRSHGATGLAIYIAAFAILSGLALLPTYAQAALGGYAFGMTNGILGALAGFAGGSIIGYVIARRASGDRVTKLIDEKPKWRAVRDALVRDHEARGFWKTTGMVALFRMPPNSPFALTNLVMASVKVPMPAFVLGTVIGMLPRTAAAVWIGHSFGLSADGGFVTPRWYLITQIIAGIVVMGIVALIADRAVKKITRPNSK